MVKHPGGRPLIFKTPKKLQIAIDGYFKLCQNEKKYPTIAGLAVALGVDRQTVYNYENKDEYFDTIKKARDKVIAGFEDRMINSTTQVAGAIFLAKNYGYLDRQEVDHSGKLKLERLLDLYDLSEETTNDSITQAAEE